MLVSISVSIVFIGDVLTVSGDLGVVPDGNGTDQMFQVYPTSPNPNSIGIISVKYHQLPNVYYFKNSTTT